MAASIDPITLRTDRLALRPPIEDDAHAIARFCGSWDVARTTSSIPHPYTIEHARDFIGFCASERESGTAANFAITLAQTGELIGMIGLIVDGPNERAELGYWIGEPSWGSGYATEASRAVVDYGFETLALQRIFAGYYAGNEASGEVQRKLGFQREGVHRRHIVRFGEAHDLVMCALLREDWNNAQRELSGPWVPVLETERLVLRPHTRADLPEVFEIWRHAGVADGVLSIPHPLTMEGAKQRFDRLLASVSRRESHIWAVTERDSGRVVGDVGVDHPSDEHRRATLGYTLHPDLWNRGLTTEALGRAVRWAMEERSPALVRLVADHYPENPASGRVLEKLGFEREGLMRSFLVKDGRHRDVVRWALVRGGKSPAG